MSEMPDLDAALTEAAQWLDQVPGVVGVGQGEEQGAPTVDVWMTDPSRAPALPQQVHGVPVRVRDSGGHFHAQEPTSE